MEKFRAMLPPDVALATRRVSAAPSAGAAKETFSQARCCDALVSASEVPALTKATAALPSSAPLTSVKVALLLVTGVAGAASSFTVGKLLRLIVTLALALPLPAELVTPSATSSTVMLLLVPDVGVISTR